MTDMKITGCVPLPGPGVVARHGDLVAVTAGGAPGPDPVLDALESVAADAGDGAALVLAAARAMLANPGQPSGACAGITAGGEVAVLVHGAAVVAVGVDGAPEAELTASGSMLPVNRTFAGTTITLRLTSGGAVMPDLRLRLDGGVVHGGGLVVTAAADVPGAPMTMTGPASSAGRMMADVPVADALAAGDTMMPDAVPPAGPMMPDPAMAGDAMMPDVAPPPSGPMMSDAAMAGNAMMTGTLPPGSMLDAPAAGMAEPPHAMTGPHEMWFTAEHDLPPGHGVPDGWRPPTFITPGPVAPGREPRLHMPDSAVEFESIPLFPPPAAPDPRDHDHAHEDAPEPAQGPGPEVAEGPDQYVPVPALVEGVLCARNHFNDPNVQYCRHCGISMVQLTRRVQRGQRPPLGVLLLDDGTGFTLDMDYVLGREPVLDGDVAAGRARPMRIADPDGTVSRLHLRISLVGWQVEVRDLGSANGSVLYLPTGERRIAPYDSMVIEPGARIGIGHRSVQYLSYRAG